MRLRLIALVVVLASTTALTGTAQAALKVTWMPGVSSPSSATRSTSARPPRP